jgi:lipopolysaccharide/colanic/teichoic acid biosynthesis glycosyltransferase
MRTTGPAKTIRLLTKGGSLPSRVGSQRESAVREGRGASASRDANRLAANTGAPAGSAASSHNGNVSLFLKHAIVELLSKSRVKTRSENASPEMSSPFSSRERNGDHPPPGPSQSNTENEISEATLEFPRWKRILDLVCILLALPVWLPLTIFAMLWIKIASPGPVFYRQERIGYRGRSFMMFKFRSMKVNVETQTHEYHLERLIKAGGPMTKLDAAGDPRLILGGLIFRATGLDELPQIFNVLRGEMSLVGPRPCTRHEFARYEGWQQKRVDAPPGLTGYWQVNGKNKTTFSEMVEMDIFYGTNMSVLLDLKILFKTIPAIALQVCEARSQRNRQSGNGAFRETVPNIDNLAGPATKV